MMSKPFRMLLISSFLLAAFTAGTGLWLRAQRRQYALNRALIDALTQEDDQRALALVNAGADPNTSYEPTPAPSFNELVMLLFHRSPSPLFNDKPTAMLIACGASWFNMNPAPHLDIDAATLVRAMLRHGAQVNAQDKDGYTLLMYAAFFDHPKTVDVLLEYGANVNAQTKSGKTLLMMAVRCPLDSSMMQKLLERANVNMQDHDGKTALMAAAYYFSTNPDMLKMLLRYGANVNMQDHDGRTALYCSLSTGGGARIIPQLLAHGADPNLADKHGKTPLKLAQEWMLVQQGPHPEVALLRRYGARK
jgi:hypothetical protein